MSLVAFLGHIISTEGVEVHPGKIKVVKSWPIIFTPTDIRSFLGIVGYYRRFVDGFASIASPFNTLNQKSMKFECSEACERIF